MPESPASGASMEAKTAHVISVATRKTGYSTRENDLYLAIEAFGAEDLRRLAGDFDAFKTMAEKLRKTSSHTRDTVVSALLERWLSLDPAGASAWLPQALEKIPAKDNLRTTIVSIFAKERPMDVLALVNPKRDASERASLISPALRQLAAHDLPRAQAWLDACTDEDDRLAASRGMRAGIVEADPLRAIEMAGAAKSRFEGSQLLNSAAQYAANTGKGVLRQLVTMPMEPWMLSIVLRSFADQDPALAVDLALQSLVDSDDPDGTAYGTKIAFAALAKRDPAQAIAKIEGLAGLEVSTAVSAIASSWVARDPAAALSWLAGKPPSERMDNDRSYANSSDSLVHGFYDWTRGDLNAARAWAAALPAGETHDLLHAVLGRTLAERGNLAGAMQVMANLGKAADPKAIGDIAEAWAREDPQAAADWAIAQPLGPAQSSALAGVVATWANDNPRGVQEWLAQFPAGEARDRSVCTYLERSGAWALSSEARIAEFDTWFDLIGDPWQRAQAAIDNYWARQTLNPEAARAWLTSLPNVDPELIRRTLRE
jgi:hypothetical protein